MILAFERHPFGWAHPNARRHQRCQFRRQPSWSDFALPAMSVYNTLSNLLELADLDHPSQGTPTTSQTQKCEPKNFEVKIDVQQYKPEELDVKMVGNSVVIEGKHEEKQDEQGFVSRQFSRRYQLPADVNPETVTCNLSPDGVLRLSAPRMIEQKKEDAKTIPINVTVTGQIEGKAQEDEKNEDKQTDKNSEKMEEAQ